jgi:putative membrane protein
MHANRHRTTLEGQYREGTFPRHERGARACQRGRPGRQRRPDRSADRRHRGDGQSGRHRRRQLAKSKSHSPQVKAFAQRIITDHTGVNKSATALVTKLHVTPEPNATSKSLQQGGDDDLSNLKSLSGAAFDKAYVDHEVAYHQAVLDAIDSTLIPSAQNAELRALLVKVRPAFVAHLEHAKKIQSSLASGGA